MRAAFRLARDALPDYCCKFSRHDFTLPQLFACLVVKEHLGRTYRGAEALLRDCDNWLADVGLRRAPDHNTLWRAAKCLLAKCRVARLLDALARWAALAKVLGLSLKPLAIDSTYFEPRHASRHYERRLREARKRRAAGRPGGGSRGRARRRRQGNRDRRRGDRRRRRAVKRLPKLAVGVAAHSHLVLSLWAGTGGGPDYRHFEPVVYDAWRRVPHRRFKVAADAGYDSEPNPRLARRDMGLASLLPPDCGRPRKGGGPPGGRWRRHMDRLLATKGSRKRCGYTQRWQVETVNSMIKRNLGSAMRARTTVGRRHELLLRVLTHNIMLLAEG